jgi:tetrahydromethanopterin S-methyltransferase subunit B
MTQEFGIREVVGQLDARMDGFERRMDGLERRMDSLDRRMEALESTINTNLRWTMGILIGTLLPMWLTMIVAIVLRT